MPVHLCPAKMLVCCLGHVWRVDACLATQPEVNCHLCCAELVVRSRNSCAGVLLVALRHQAMGITGYQAAEHWLGKLLHSLKPARLSLYFCVLRACTPAGGTAAELVLGIAPATVSGSPASTSTTPTGGASGVSNGGAFEPPVLTCADWMRRGALAERLGHTLDARSAYRAAVKLSFNLTSYLALMRLEAEADSISNTALCASQILGWHQQRAGQHNPGGSSGSGSAQGSAQGTSSSASSGGSSGANNASGGLVLMGVPPSEVTWALGVVADCSSVEEVRSGMADIPPAAQAMLSAVLDEWQRWQQVTVAAALAARQPQK